jgi:hypothetical protein
VATQTGGSQAAAELLEVLYADLVPLPHES